MDASSNTPHDGRRVMNQSLMQPFHFGASDRRRGTTPPLDRPRQFLPRLRRHLPLAPVLSSFCHEKFEPVSFHDEPDAT